MGRKLVVEILSAHNLMPKDGHGSAHAYCMVEFDGQRQTTRVRSRDLSPSWNEKLEFEVRNPNCLAFETIKVEVYSESPKDKVNRKRDPFLGRVHIPGGSIKKQGDGAIVAHGLEKRSMFSHVKGELRIRAFYLDAAEEKKDESKKKKDESKKDDSKKDELKKDESKKDEKKDEQQQQQQHKSKDESKKEEKKDQDHRKIAAVLPAPTIVPAADYALKVTAPVIATEKAKSYDLVERMHYLFVRVVKARSIAKEEAFVIIKFGEALQAKKKAASKDKAMAFEEVFAFCKERIQGPTVEIVVAEDEKGSKDCGCVVFELADIPFRVPDSPLAPQWYALEDRKTKTRRDDGGEIMLAIWWGSQADESFPIAWQSDTGGFAHTKAKVYLSPKLWYLRVNVIEAQDLAQSDKARFPDASVIVELGQQKRRTKQQSRGTVQSCSPLWNEDLLFVAAEPFEEELVIRVEDSISPNKDELLGIVKVPLANNGAIHRRLDISKEVPTSHWFNLKDEKCSASFRGRVHLRLCFEGGYHVMEESTQYTSDARPTAKQLQKRSIGILEVGILQAKSLLPMKTKDGRGTTDGYCVAKYGPKWVRTRTVVDSLTPRWNEQYTWDVFDPSTVVTICVFDNCQISGQQQQQDGRIGKVRIRLSTLESDRVYANSYPLIVLQPGGVKKMGELELTVRFTASALVSVLQSYLSPQLPKAHYIHPLLATEQERLRVEAIRIVSSRLGRAEPSLRREVIHYVLDTDSNLFSMRRSKGNYMRLAGVFSGIAAVASWFDQVCRWTNPVTTLLVHVLFLILAWFPELILPTLFLYLFLIGAWQYRFRPRSPPAMDFGLSQGGGGAVPLSPEELDEEFDTFPSSRPHDVVRARYERLRIAASRLQTVVGDFAAQGERINALLSWRDPRATGIFLAVCLALAILLYVTPFQVVVVLAGLYLLRHPRFREKMPPPPLNFFRRLPSLADRIL